MDGMIRGQLKGEMRFDWRAEGLSCEIALRREVERPAALASPACGAMRCPLIRC